MFGMALEKCGAFVEFEREEKAACGGDTEWGGWVPWLPEDRQFSYVRGASTRLDDHQERSLVCEM